MSVKEWYSWTTNCTSSIRLHSWSRADRLFSCWYSVSQSGSYTVLFFKSCCKRKTMRTLNNMQPTVGQNECHGNMLCLNLQQWKSLSQFTTILWIIVNWLVRVNETTISISYWQGSIIEVLCFMLGWFKDINNRKKNTKEIYMTTAQPV